MFKEKLNFKKNNNKSMLIYTRKIVTIFVTYLYITGDQMCMPLMNRAVTGNKM